MRGMQPSPRYQELLMVRDKVGRPQVCLGKQVQDLDLIVPRDEKITRKLGVTILFGCLISDNDATV